jgi:hypothetical protein
VVISFILIIMGAGEPLRIIMGTGISVVRLAAEIIMRWIVVIRAG